MLPGGRRADFLDVDLAGDHVVSEPDHDLGEQLQPVALLVRDQDAQVLEGRLEATDVNCRQCRIGGTALQVIPCFVAP